MNRRPRRRAAAGADLPGAGSYSLRRRILAAACNLALGGTMAALQEVRTPDRGGRRAVTSPADDRRRTAAASPRPFGAHRVRVPRATRPDDGARCGPAGLRLVYGSA